MKISSKNINSILEKEDIEGYVHLGAPSDEYTSESKDIAAAILQLDESERTEENIIAILMLEWMESFNLSETDMAQRADALRNVAKAIMQKMQ